MALPVKGQTKQKIDPSKIAGDIIDDVIVPVPSEVFMVLDKLGQPDWKSELPDIIRSRFTGDRAHVALLLGTVIADGFVAVQAQNSERVKETGREVLRLAAAIGVRESVVRRSKSIIDAADNKDWRGIRSELDKALLEVRTAMQELNDEKLAQLVSLGGWLRGTEVVTSIIEKNYSADRAELLNQPLLIDYFSSQLHSMPPGLEASSFVVSIKSGLKKIRPLIGDGNDVISKESVIKIHEITSELVVSILATEE